MSEELEAARSTAQRLEAELALARQRCDDLNVALELARCAETDLQTEMTRLRELVDSQATELRVLNEHSTETAAKLGRARGEADVQDAKRKLEVKQQQQACVLGAPADVAESAQLD